MNFTVERHFIDETNYFEVETCLMNNERIVKPRTIKGLIDIEFDVNYIQNDITNYLIYQHNIEIINLISQRLYKSNWFECYEKSLHPAAAGCENKLEESLIGDNDHVLPNELYKTSSKLIVDTKYTSFKYIPIWHYNGNRKSKHTELYCHFEVLLHILSRKFARLDSKIMRYASLGIQKAYYQHQALDELSGLNQNELINKYINIKMENADLNSKLDNIYDLVHEMKEIHKEQVKDINDKYESIISTINRQHEKTREVIQSKANELKGHVTTNSSKRKQFYNRIYVRNEDLNKTESTLIINRCMKENLPSLDDDCKSLLEIKCSSATESLNEYLENNKHLYLNRIDSNKIKVLTKNINTIIESFENHIINRDKNVNIILKEITEVPEEEPVNPYTNILTYEWLLNTHYYKLFYDETNNKLYYKSGAKKTIVYLEKPIELLKKHKSRSINKETKGKIRKITSKDGVYVLN